MATFSSAVMVATRRNDWNTIPTAARRHSASRSSFSCVRSAPATTTRPALARSRPPIIIIRLDLPAPDGPTTPTDSPAATDSPTPRRMLTSPAALASFRCTSSRSIIDADGLRQFLNATSARRRTPMRDPVARYATTSARAYGVRRRFINIVPVALVVALGLLAALPGVGRGDPPVKLLVVGDSLTAGYGLPSEESFTAQLQAALKADGLNVTVVNAGVSGDTSAGGLARLDWLLADKPDFALVELGANDGLRGLDPQVTYDNLDAVLT